MKPLIDVQNLTLLFDTDEGRITAVDDVSFSIMPGEIMGLVGESGSGKSVTAKSLMYLNAPNAIYADESKILLNTEDVSLDVLKLTTQKQRKVVRGGAICLSAGAEIRPGPAPHSFVWRGGAKTGMSGGAFVSACFSNMYK